MQFFFSEQSKASSLYLACLKQMNLTLPALLLAVCLFCWPLWCLLVGHFLASMAAMTSLLLSSDCTPSVSIAATGWGVLHCHR